MRHALAAMIVFGLAASASAQSGVGAGVGDTRSPSVSRNGAAQTATPPAARVGTSTPASPRAASLIPTRPLAAGAIVANRGDEPTGAVDDNLFAAAAAAGGMYEVTSSRIALDRAACDGVKQFAQQMINDHTKASKELMALAARKQIPLPTALDIKDRASENILAGLSGEKFDECYARQQELAHKGTIALFMAEAERGRDPEVKAWASKMLPTLRDHEKHVKMICEKHMKEEMKDKSGE